MLIHGHALIFDRSCTRCMLHAVSMWLLPLTIAQVHFWEDWTRIIILEHGSSGAQGEGWGCSTQFFVTLPWPRRYFLGVVKQSTTNLACMVKSGNGPFVYIPHTIKASQGGSSGKKSSGYLPAHERVYGSEPLPPWLQPAMGKLELLLSC